MELIIAFIVWLLLSVAIGYFAYNRGRDPFFWFVIGGLFGIFGLLALFLMPPVKESSDREKEQEPEKEAEEIEAGIREAKRKEWFYLDDEKIAKGPIGFDALKQLWDNETVHSETFLWCEGMEGWKHLRELDSLYEALQE